MTRSVYEDCDDSVTRFTVTNGQAWVRGDIDLLCLPTLEAWLSSLGPEHQAVDLSGVTFFDSCALRAFLNARRRNPLLRIVAPSKSVLHVLQITGSDDYLMRGREIAHPS